MIWLRSGVALGGLLALWHAAVVFWSLPPYIMPAPAGALRAIFDNHQMMLPHIVYSLQAFTTGLLLSICLSGALAVLLQAFPTLRQSLMPILVFLRVIPFVAVAPILALLIGRNMGTSIVVVCMASIFPLLVNLLSGFSAADRNVAALLTLYAASPAEMVMIARLPYALPYFFAGLKAAIPQAFLAVLIAEWLTGSKGLGFLILDTADNRQTELLWGTVLVVTVISLSFLCVADSLQRLVARRVPLSGADAAA